MDTVKTYIQDDNHVTILCPKCSKPNLHISQAIYCEAVKHSPTSSESLFVRLPTLEKHPQHTDSMPPGVFRRAPCIHNPFRLLATIFVKYAG